jgi:hypothetical protein
MIPIHVGTHAPSEWDAIAAKKPQSPLERVAMAQNSRRRPSVSRSDLDWSDLGFDPHWEDQDAATCLVALEPQAYGGSGVSQFDRFLDGAQRRDELALVVTTLRQGDDDDDDGTYSVFGFAHREDLPGWKTTITAEPVAARTQIERAGGLSPTDNDLALRLTDRDHEWCQLRINGWEEHSFRGAIPNAPAGEIEPILVTSIGEIIVGAWVSPDGAERRYILPPDVDWEMVADWLRNSAIPHMLPAAAIRLRLDGATPRELLTAREREATDSLAQLTREYEEAREALAQTLDDATAEGSKMRDLLLYGIGDDLERGIATALRDAGFVVTELDPLYGTQSADLLCEWEGHRRLVEVKSAGGRATEKLYDYLRKHLSTWAAHPERDPVDGGVLVINYEHQTPPLDRSPQPFSRIEFVRSLTDPVVGTVELYNAWRTGDWERIRTMFLPGLAGAPRTAAPFSPRRRRFPWHRDG